MSIDVQLASFTAYLIFGLIVIYIYEIFLRKKPLYSYIVFPITTLIFTYVIYHINDGKLHIYFIGMFIIGIILGKISVKFIQKHLIKLKAKIKK